MTSTCSMTVWCHVVQGEAVRTWLCPVYYFLTLKEMMTENCQIHIKTSRWRNWKKKKVISYEVKWELSTPLKEVYTSLILAACLAQMKTPSDECMKIQDERQAFINTDFIGKKNSYDREYHQLLLSFCFCFCLSVIDNTHNGQECELLILSVTTL